MKCKILTFLAFSLAQACSNPSPSSDLHWAQFPTAANYGSIPGRLLIAASDKDRNFDKVRVCVQGSSSYEGAALLSEVKLAFAAWLQGFGADAPAAWERLSFVPQEKCSETDASFGAVVAVASFEHPASEQSAAAFNSMSCIPFPPNPRLIRFPNYDCNTYGQVLGLAGPGGMARGRNIYRSVAPTMATLSPYVEWVSLEQEFLASLRLAEAGSVEVQKARMEGWSRENEFLKSDIESLLASYRLLVQNAENLTYSELIQWLGSLERLSYTTTSMLAFTPDPFQLGQFRPQRSAFHTLLHEVGHQFGMAHAHDPQSDDLTGPSPSARQENGQWVCEESAMGYSKSYAYLTEDDKLGIADLHKTLSQLINK